jgi:hypothetical protein
VQPVQALLAVKCRWDTQSQVEDDGLKPIGERPY